jgi:two-component system, OmpR family, phosphate regulon sensor histidine kinase PhoR
MSDGVALIAGDGRIVRSNHQFATLLDKPRPAEPGTRLADFVRHPELHELVAHAREARTAVEADVRLWTPRARLLHAGATALGPEVGAPVLLVLRDLTEIESVSRMRQEFVANVSHELRTPLTTIRGYAETLLDGALDDVEHRREFVEAIRGGASRLEQMVHELLSLSELERTGGSLRRETVDLRALAEGQVRVAVAAAGRAGLTLEIEPGDPVLVEGDRARLEQVLANLIDNAIKYTERGGITVRLGADPGVVWCEVADTGPGIPPDDQPRVFERFYRVDKARSREKGGTGLGLSIVKHIVMLHGGEVGVRSTPGEGSTFRFEIPSGSPASRH